MPSSTAAASSSSTSLVSRSVLEVDAAFFVAALAATAVGEGASVGDCSAPMGSGEDGGAVAAGGAVLGAGMTVTTARGEEVRRRRVGEGEGCAAAVGLALCGPAVLVGDGRGSTGEGVACAPEGLLARGLALAVAVALGEAVAFGVAVALAGLGLGVAAEATPIRTPGVARATATGSTTRRSRNERGGTRRL